jgi:hypothetical protein
VKYLMMIALALTACGGKKEDKKETPPPATGSAMAGSGSAAMTGSGSAAPAAAAVDVPTEMDFESQAKTDITDKNVDQQVKKIETDLGSN